MNNRNISSELLEIAKSYGLCEDWKNDWGNANMDKLVQMYVKGIDFCIVHNYPSVEYIKKNFGHFTEKYGVYTDARVNIENPEIAILNGKCTGEVLLDGFICRSIYVRHESKVRIEINGSAMAFIRVYDNAQVIVDNQGTSKVFVYRYGNDCKIYTCGNVVVRER